MKKIVLILIAVFGFAKSGISQFSLDSLVHPADSVHQAYKQTMNAIFEHVDLDEVPSGILIRLRHLVYYAGSFPGTTG